MQGTVPPVHLIVRLEVPNRPAREFSYDFRQEVITLGRDPQNDIPVPLTTVSRRHARIFFERGDFFLEDLGSTHGTSHNGKKLAKKEKKLLRDGDTIAVMEFSIAFKTTAARMLDRQPGEKTEQLARRMVQEVLASLGGEDVDPTSLRIMNGSDEGRRYPIAEGQAEVVLGRAAECDLVLDDHNTSRRHCLIRRTWNGFTAQDLGSKNGVLVNGVRIEGQKELKDGDEIQVGGVKLTFIDPASRILDQFGGFGEETAMPGAPSTAEQESADEEPEAEDEPAEQYEPEEDEPEPQEEEEEEEDPEVPAASELLPPAGDLPPVAPTKGIGAEVVILILGVGFLFAAIGLAVFLYL